LNRRLHLESGVAQPIGHLDGVCEGKLRDERPVQKDAEPDRAIRRRVRVALLLAAAMPGLAAAKPIAFAHGTTVMAEYGAGTMEEAQVFYAPTYKLSAGLGYGIERVGRGGGSCHGRGRGNYIPISAYVRRQVRTLAFYRHPSAADRQSSGALRGAGRLGTVLAFIDGAHRDYRLQIASLGIDYAPPTAADDRDLDNFARDVDLPTVPNVWGRRDLGAYERQRTLNCGSGTAETIFCDGFELF